MALAHHGFGEAALISTHPHLHDAIKLFIIDMAGNRTCCRLINLTITINIPLVLCDTTINYVRITGIKGNLLSNLRIIFANFQFGVRTILNFS